MSMLIDDQAKKLIDSFADQLIKLNGGDKIPAVWTIYLNKALKASAENNKKRKIDSRRNIDKEEKIVIEYLTLVVNANPLSEYDGKPINFPYKVEEEIPIGIQKQLAEKYKTSESQISKILSKWRNDKDLFNKARVAVIAKGLFD